MPTPVKTLGVGCGEPASEVSVRTSSSASAYADSPTGWSPEPPTGQGALPADDV